MEISKKLPFSCQLNKNYDIIVNINIELDKNVNLGIGQFVSILFN